jgi:hypothetical protein
LILTGSLSWKIHELTKDGIGLMSTILSSPVHGEFAARIAVEGRRRL